MTWETTKCIDAYRKARSLSVFGKKNRELELKNRSNENRNNFDKIGTMILVLISLYIVMSFILTR